MSVRPAQLVSLMKGVGLANPAAPTADADARRNICILAHVDHGKTTLSDSLLAANGIISSKLAGKVRYLDSRPDEQERGITMEASAISLLFKLLFRNSPPRSADDSNPATTATASKDSGVAEIERSYLINLIDSPGHVDFSSEVYTASRLCDGALVLVDAVEGVCTQTHTVLRQAWVEGVVPVLVINKIDRLVTELRMTPAEAYDHLRKILEAVNAVVGSMWTGQQMEDDERKRRKDAHDGSEAETVDDKQSGSDMTPLSSDLYEQWTLADADDEDLYFSPEKGNVIFSSAVDGWAFRVNDFARLYADKLGTSEKLLTKCLWGDFYLDPKTKKVLTWKGLKGRHLKPMFVQFVLDNVWRVYETIMIQGDKDQTEKIIKALNVKVLPREMRSKDSRTLLSIVMSQWLPLAPAVLRTVVEHLPSPTAAQRLRLPRLLHPSKSLRASTTMEPESPLEEALYCCDQSDDAPCVAYVSKVFSVPEASLPENRRVQLTAEELRQRAQEARAQRDAAAAAAKAADSSSVDDANDVVAGPKAVSVITPPPPPPPPTTITLSSPSPLLTMTPDVELDGVKVSKPNEKLVGFARLYSGTLRLGMRLYILGPKYNPAYPGKHRSEMVVEDLYLVMGDGLEKLESVPAGCVFGIGLRPGNGDSLLKSATLCSMDGFKSLGRVGFEVTPIVRVALEPEDPSEMSQLTEGLRLLNQADPCVQVLIQETGEHVILTAGELHLERCLRDLREKFAKIAIQVSPPIVPFRETVVMPTTDSAAPKEPSTVMGVSIIKSSGPRPVTLRVRCVPLPQNVTCFLLKHTMSMKALVEERGGRRAAGELQELDMAMVREGADLTEAFEEKLSMDEFLVELRKEFQKAAHGELAELWETAVDRLWAFGPRRIGPNVLINGIPTYKRKAWVRHAQKGRIADRISDDGGSRPSTPEVGFGADDESSIVSGSQFGDAAREDHPVRELDEAIQTGFQLVSSSGPLCAEPLMGTAFVVEDFLVEPKRAETAAAAVAAAAAAAAAAAPEGSPREDGEEAEDTSRSRHTAPMAGQVIALAKEGCKQAFLSLSPRLMLATYTCDIQAQTEVLGKVYAVIARRKGRILNEEMKEGTTFWMIKARLPVVESFGFAEDIRKRTSGAASPQLIFSGFEILDQDPFWVPTTEEELEDLGEKADRENVAKKYMDAVRRRKGMFLERKIVEHAEKQRTLRK